MSAVAIPLSQRATDRTMAVARKFGVSEERVSQLRRRYEQSWRQFQGLAEAAAAA